MIEKRWDGHGLFPTPWRAAPPVPAVANLLGWREVPAVSQPEAPLLDLPELDKGDEAGEVDVGVFELNVGEGLLVEGEDVALDAFEVELQEQDDPGSNEAASDLDIGTGGLLDALPETPPARDGDDLPYADGELDQHLEAPLESDDPSTDAELGDDGLETLPELAAEDGDGDSGPELERPLLPGAPEGAIAKGPVFQAEWLALGSPCSALWAGSTQVLASGQRLMRFGQERASQPLGSGEQATSIALLEGDSVMLATPRGLLELPAEGPLAVIDLPDAARGSGAEVVELAGSQAAPGLWARLSNGMLLTRRAGAWLRHEAGGKVRSLASAELGITLLIVGERPTLQLSADGGSSFREVLLPEPAATVALGDAPTALALAATVAIADTERGLCVSSDAGASFRMVTGAVNVTAIAIGEHAGKPVVFAALYREGRDLSELVMVDPASGEARSVAELQGAPDEDAEELGRTAALLFAQGQLWAAGSYGLVKLQG